MTEKGIEALKIFGGIAAGAIAIICIILLYGYCYDNVCQKKQPSKVEPGDVSLV
jgi:hypothetical protein